MSVEFKPTSTILAELGFGINGKTQKFLTDTCAKHMDKYVPFREGTLAGTVIMDGQPTANVTDHTITYETPYARYVYYGISKTGKEMHYTTDMHENAGPYWDRRMVSAEMDTVVKEVQKFIDRGAK